MRFLFQNIPCIDQNKLDFFVDSSLNFHNKVIICLPLANIELALVPGHTKKYLRNIA